MSLRDPLVHRAKGQNAIFYVSWAPWAEDAIPWSLRVTAILSHWPWKMQPCLIYQTTGFYSPVSHLGTLCETPLGIGGSERTRNLFAQGLVRPVCEFAGAFLFVWSFLLPRGAAAGGWPWRLGLGRIFPHSVTPQDSSTRGLWLAFLQKEQCPRTSLLQDVLAYSPETLIASIRPPNQSRCTGPGGRRFPCMGVQLPRFPGTVSRLAGTSHTAKLPPSGGGRGFTWAAFPLRSGHPCSHSRTGQLCPSRGSCLGAVLVVMLGA